MLVSLMRLVGTIPNHIRILEFYLGASKVDEYEYSNLAIALTSLHPHPNDTSPHHIQSVKLFVDGNFLFTRYIYLIFSPAMPEDDNWQLNKLKASPAYRINITEKTVSRVLLGIPGM
jgi:hypothetical protein